jgi:hypothetical protein
MSLFAGFYEEQGEASREETLGFADLADRTPELRYGDVWGTVHGFYRMLSEWEDQEDAQHLRDAMAAFYRDASDQRSFIPEDYATELQIAFGALADMAWPDGQVWVRGQTGVGLAISDTLMYQRGDPAPSDPDMSSLYGLALPLVKCGVALNMVQLERLPSGQDLEKVHVLLLTYEGQKPPCAEVHEALARWVREGHTLILFGVGDEYNSVREWWNTGDLAYAAPQAHLTERLGLGRQPDAGRYPCGQGWAIVDPASPAGLAQDPDGADRVTAHVEAAVRAQNQPWSPGNVLALRRGPYLAAAGMDESPEDQALVLPGRYVNLLDARLPIHVDPAIDPGTRWLLYDLSRCADQPWVIAAAGRVRHESREAGSLSFTVEGMDGTTCAVRARIPAEPVQVTVDGERASHEWDAASRTVLIRFANQPGGRPVQVTW